MELRLQFPDSLLKLVNMIPNHAVTIKKMWPIPCDNLILRQITHWSIENDHLPIEKDNFPEHS